MPEEKTCGKGQGSYRRRIRHVKQSLHFTKNRSEETGKEQTLSEVKERIFL